MNDTVTKDQKKCVLIEKEVAIRALHECDKIFDDNNEERRNCRRSVARNSGERSRTCMTT